VSDVLGPLIEYDQRRKGRLVQTVTAYLRHRGSLRQAALDLGVHENTVQLRLARASQLIGSDLHDPQRLGLLAIALSWYQLLGEREPGESTAS
jgi:DNA-binding PucR family transcriptional regulator